MRVLASIAFCALLFTPMATACSDPGEETVKENRLAKERSPYLRQHRLNPVDWYPWGPEALERAQRENKPIFLSIGYAACHWCHVMEHESFEDPETARRMNETFVCVKVDREERPDLDRVYMSVVQLLTGRGGWPMTVLLTPDAKPFWGGTYLPRQGLKSLITQVGTLWKEKPDRLKEDAARIADRVAETSGGRELPETDDSDAEILHTMKLALGGRYDHRHGGYGDRPKFPPHTELLYFLDGDGKRAGPEEREQVYGTLDAMERGGIHDQVGGGFHRYSTDERWLLPHFEKMLYDNGLLAQAYARAFAQTGEARYRRVVERIFEWLERAMKRPGGGYASSLDADTEGEEGLTYTWTLPELKEALSEADYRLSLSLFGAREDGNFNDESSGRRSGRNILHLPVSLADAARERSLEEGALRTQVDSILKTLRTVRAKRAQPGLDDKVITGWNGLLLSAFAHAGKDLKESRYLERARALAGFLLSACRRADGTLLRFPRGSGPEIPAFCEDHVHLIEGLLDLAEATGETTWVKEARGLAERLNKEFRDPVKGGFFTTSTQQHEDLFARGKETWDSPIPSDNGSAARLNLRLHALTGEEAFRKAADGTLSAFRPLMAHPRMAAGVMGLIRALALRSEMEAAGGLGAVRGDVHAHRDVVAVDVFLQRGEARLGARVDLVVRVRLDEGWHAYAHRISNADLIPTGLVLAEGAPAALEQVRYPKAISRVLGPSGTSPIELYEGTFEIRAVLLVPEGVPLGPRKIPLELRLQSCNADLCQPPLTLRLELPLRYADEDGPARHPSIFEASK